MSDNPDKNLDYAAEGGSVVDVHDAVRREKVLPPTGKEPISFGPLILTALVLILGAGYLGAYSNGFRDDIYVTKYYRPDPRPAGAGGSGLRRPQRSTAAAATDRTALAGGEGGDEGPQPHRPHP